LLPLPVAVFYAYIIVPEFPFQIAVLLLVVIAVTLSEAGGGGGKEQ